MAVREIKTTLAVDGEKAFNKAVTEAGRNMRVMASEMKAAAADFDLTGDEMEYMGRKSRALNSQIAQQENIIRALEGAVADSAAAYGEASAKTDGYRIKLNNAQAAMAKLKKELEDSNREMTELGRDSGRVGRQLETGIGEAAEDASRKVEALVNTMNTDLSGIGKAISFSAFKDGFDLVSGAVTSVVNGIEGLIEGTLDFRRTMSYLEANAISAGMDVDVVKGMTFEVAALTGELDGAVEGMSNLIGAGLEADELAVATKRLSAAVLAFPDTYKFETLAEDLRMAIGEGEITGSIAELLTTWGVDLEVANKSLKEAGKKGKEAVETAMTAWIENPQAQAALETYEEMNAAMLEGQQLQMKLDDEWAKGAETLEPYANKLKKLKLEILSWANEGLKEVMEENADREMTWFIPEEPKTDEHWETIQKNWSNLKKAGEKIKGEIEEAFTVNPNIDLKANLQTWEDINPGYRTDAQEEGEDAGTAMLGGFDEALKKGAPEMQTWDDFAPGYSFEAEETGKDIVTGIEDGMEEKENSLLSTFKGIVSRLQEEANKGVVIPIRMENQTSTTKGNGTDTQGGSVTLTLDGKNVGSTTTPYISTSMGLALARTETYG